MDSVVYNRVFIRWNIRGCVRNPKCEGLGAGLEIAQLEVFAKRIFKSFIGRYWVYSLDSKFTFAPSLQPSKGYQTR